MPGHPHDAGHGGHGGHHGGGHHGGGHHHGGRGGFFGGDEIIVVSDCPPGYYYDRFGNCLRIPGYDSAGIGEAAGYGAGDPNAVYAASLVAMPASPPPANPPGMMVPLGVPPTVSQNAPPIIGEATPPPPHVLFPSLSASLSASEMTIGLLLIVAVGYGLAK